MQKQSKNTKPEQHRLYGYTGKANMNWVEKESKKFGSKARFLDALLTEARKSKIQVAAPKATITKKTAKPPKKAVKTSKKPAMKAAPAKKTAAPKKAKTSKKQATTKA